MNARRCSSCGKFLPCKGYICYVEYSGVCEFEPREATYMCKPCYEKSDKELIDKIAWIKPYEVRREDEDGKQINSKTT